MLQIGRVLLPSFERICLWDVLNWLISWRRLGILTLVCIRLFDGYARISFVDILVDRRQGSEAICWRRRLNQLLFDRTTLNAATIHQNLLSW